MEIQNPSALSHLQLPDDAGLPKSKGSLGKEDFLKLLLAQMQNQDPMKPMDHQEFTTQLAQFSSLEQLSNIGKGIEGMQGRQDDGTKLQALTMIGKRVQATQQEIRLLEGSPAALSHSLPENVKPTKATIFDSQGNVIRELGLEKAQGREIVWDGNNDNGARMPPGTYAFRISGTDEKGMSQESSGEISGVVSGVEMMGKNPVLVVDTGKGKTKLSMDKINQVFMKEETEKPVTAPAVKTAPPVISPIKTEGTEEEPENDTELAQGDFSEVRPRFEFPLLDP